MEAFGIWTVTSDTHARIQDGGARLSSDAMP
jgi:hypothetical protein